MTLGQHRLPCSRRSHHEDVWTISEKRGSVAIVSNKKVGISYIRWSSAGQTKGSSLDRQTSARDAFCKEYGIELLPDSKLIDVAKSASGGAHVEHGELGKFLEAAEAGKFKKFGDEVYFIVESFDRLNRAQDIKKYQNLLDRITEARINVVTLRDGTIHYHTDSPHFNQTEANIKTMASAALMFVSAEEINKKIKWINGYIEKNRNKAIAGEGLLTPQGPAWLKPNKDKNGWDVIPDRVEVIEKIFLWYAEGKGTTAICSALDEEGLKTWGGKRNKTGKWSKTYVTRILACLLYTSPSPRDQRGSRMPSSA